MIPAVRRAADRAGRLAVAALDSMFLSPGTRDLIREAEATIEELRRQHPHKTDA